MDFRTSASNIVLNVNDNGGVVVLPVSDEGWIEKFMDYLKTIEQKSKERSEEAGDDSNKNIIESVLLARECKDGFDAVFGEGAYDAVYGMELVGVEYIIEFIEACIPYIEKRLEKRNSILTKYNPERTGGAF